MNQLSPVALTVALVAAVATLTAPAAGQACMVESIHLYDDDSVAVVQYWKGLEARDRGAAQIAIRHFERSLKGEGDPETRGNAALEAARLHAAQGQSATAIARMKDGLAVCGTHFDLRLELGRALLDGQPLEALAHLEKAAEIAATDLTVMDRNAAPARLYPDLALAYAHLGQRGKALETLDRARTFGSPVERLIEVQAVIGEEVIVGPLK